ncbi:MAG: TatD family hydrolase, partial [Actinomycetota bacterium]
MNWTDNHCHLPDDMDLAAEVVQNAKDSGVHRLIDVGTSIEHSVKCIARANEFDGVWATAGVHPHDAKDGIEGLEQLVTSPKVVAVGECGLDYHYDHSPRDIQRDVFAKQIQLAHQFDLPLVIHTREAWEDTFDILDTEGTP